MRTGSKTIALVALLFAPSAGFAETITCKTTDLSRDMKPHIGPTITVRYDADRVVALVDDGFPVAEELPHRGKVGRDNSSVFSVSWRQPSLGATTPRSDYRGLTVRMSVRRTNGRAVLTGSVGNNRISYYSGKARCVFGSG